MAVNRSPRYPAIDLATAISMVEKIFDKEGRAPVKEDVAMRHLGYGGLNGASVKVLSALRKYGLVEGAAGGIKVSQDAIVICANRHQPTSPDRITAIRRAAFRVELFSDLHEHFGTEPSEQNLAAQLVVRGFSQEGAVKAARAFRATMALVDTSEMGEDSTDSAPESPVGYAEVSSITPPHIASGVGHAAATSTAVAEGGGEREWLRGPLSRGTSYRLMVSGDMGPRQLGKLIKLLQAQQAVLEDDDDGLDDVLG